LEVAEHKLVDSTFGMVVQVGAYWQGLVGDGTVDTALAEDVAVAGVGRFVIDKSYYSESGFRVGDCMTDCVDGLALDDGWVDKSKHFLHLSLRV
jgi:hypothetical protein